MTTTTDGKEEIVGKVIFEHDIPRAMVDDLMTTAFDGGYGGSWFWIKDYAMTETTDGTTPEFFHDGLSHGARMEIELYDDDVEDGVTTYWLTLDKIINGIKLYCESRRISPSVLWDDHDAASADSVVQYALWDKEIYG
jgi:hypothetical protein